MTNKLWLTCLLLPIGFSSYGQEKVDWSAGYTMDTSDFRGKVPYMEEDYVQRYYLASQLGFSYQMNSYQFAFTKNFNKYIEVYFKPSSSWIERGEQTDLLLAMASLDFDLAELYARKFRKSIYENKKLVSSTQLFQEEFEKVSNTYSDRRAQMMSEVMASSMPHETLASYRQHVNLEILTLEEFCKACKPKKK